jgi:hypothetical protein
MNRPERAGTLLRIDAAGGAGWWPAADGVRGTGDGWTTGVVTGSNARSTGSAGIGAHAGAPRAEVGGAGPRGPLGRVSGV